MVFQEKTYSVLLVSSAEKFFSTMTELLPVTDYWPVSSAKSVGEAQRQLLERQFDLVVINAPLSDDFGLRLAIDLCANSSAGVLLMVKNEIFNDVYASTVGYGVLTLSKPTSVQSIAQSLRILCATRERMRRVDERTITLEAKMQEIRLINRAKWHLIEARGMTESEAHRFIEKQAMDRRLSKQEIAECILCEGNDAKSS